MGYLQDFDHGLDGADRKKKVHSEAEWVAAYIHNEQDKQTRIKFLYQKFEEIKLRTTMVIIHRLCSECARGDKATQPLSGGWRHDQDYCEAGEIWEMLSNE